MLGLGVDGGGGGGLVLGAGGVHSAVQLVDDVGKSLLLQAVDLSPYALCWRPCSHQIRPGRSPGRPAAPVGRSALLSVVHHRKAGPTHLVGFKEGAEIDKIGAECRTGWRLCRRFSSIISTIGLVGKQT